MRGLAVVRSQAPTGRRRRWARELLGPVVLAFTVVAAAGCSEEAPPDPTLDPEPVHREGAIGQAEDLFGVEVEVMRIDEFSQSVDGFPRLAVSLRSHNSTLERRRNPFVELQCEEARKGGDWFAGSTWNVNGQLLPGAVEEGVLYVGFPHKEEPRYPVARCTDPRLVITGVRSADRAKVVVSVPVPAATISKAIDQPRGRPMPLPNRQ